MIFLFGDYGVYNRNAAILGIKELFDGRSMPCQIITPTLDPKFQRNRAAQASNFLNGSIWSIYDCFTGRMMREDRVITPADYHAPSEYKPTAGPGSRKFVKYGGETIELVVRVDGTVESADYYENDHLIKRDSYDDGGCLVSQEYPLGEEDVHAKILDQRGDPIFELYLIGKYRKVGKVKFVPENLDFLSENEFWKWAFERLVDIKTPEDKFFIMNEAFRKAIQTANFKNNGVYLLQTAAFDENNSKDLMFDHYEKLIFNSHDELNKVAVKFDEKTDSKLYWNNFIAFDRIAPNYQTDLFPVYLNLGTESETVNFSDVADFIKTSLDEEEKVRFVIEFSLLRNQVDFLALLAEKGLSEEVIRRRISPLTRPWPEKIRAEMSRAILYIHYQNQEVLSLTLSTAIAAEKPILAIQGDPLLTDYLDEDNGKVITDASVARLIKQAIYDIEYIRYVAPDPAKQRKLLSPETTMWRWNNIFSDTGTKL
jgi:hypothetical protein